MAFSLFSCYDVKNEKKIVASGGRHGESAEKIVARHGENIEMVVDLETEKKIIVEHTDYAWMALYMPSTPLPPVATVAVAVSVTVRSCALFSSALSFAALKQRVGHSL